MTFEWIAFVELAQRLAQEFPTDEAALRTAVSRAYFGAFCHAKQYAVEKLGFRPGKDADDHGRLRSSLKGKFPAVGILLQQIRELRNQADYERDCPADWPLSVGVALREAAKIVQQLPLA